MALTIATAVSAHALDHSTFDRILKKYVKSGVVNYKGLKADKDFPGYLQTISHTKVSGLSQSEQLSFWINAYNASCLNGVLRRYPIKSVMNDKQFFSKKEHKVAGQTLSLNDVEHGILRKQFKEPRIHFAVNCASKSCPPLADTAYVASKLNSQLDAAARRFINDPTRNKFDVAGKKAMLSALFKWYGKDFGSQSQMLNTIAKYASASVAGMLRSGNVAVSYLRYDWGLNGS